MNLNKAFFMLNDYYYKILLYIFTVMQLTTTINKSLARVNATLILL